MNNITSPTAQPIAVLVERIKSEFTEMPGLQLTSRQAERLWSLNPLQCEAILGALVDVAFLRRTPAGSYVRVNAPPSTSQLSLAAHRVWSVLQGETWAVTPEDAGDAEAPTEIFKLAGRGRRRCRSWS